MLRKTDYCKEFKNGNINIKFDNDAIEEFKKDADAVGFSDFKSKNS